MCSTHATFCGLPAVLRGASSEGLSSSTIKGTAARIIVPLPGFDSTEKLPWTKFIRSCILTRPNPELFFASSTSKPAPASCTTSWISSPVALKATENCWTPLYFTALCRASWAIRKKHSEMSFGRCAGTFLSVNPTLTWCCFENAQVFECRRV
jgi:hypothetical protein